MENMNEIVKELSKKYSDCHISQCNNCNSEYLERILKRFNDVDKIRKLYNIDVVFSNAIKLSFNILLFILILTNGY